MREIESEIGKLMRAYEQKISNCRAKLEHLAEKRRELRHDQDSLLAPGYTVESLREERQETYAQLYAYQQAIADFDSLLDYIDD